MENTPKIRIARCAGWTAPLGVTIACLVLHAPTTTIPQTLATAADAKTEYVEKIQPLLKKYCLDCHSTNAKKGSLDLERFKSTDEIRNDLKPWQSAIEMLETEEMPPKAKPQPTAEERKALIAWMRSFLDAEARAARAILATSRCAD